MNLLPIANRLEEQGIGINGRTIFVNFMPAEVTEGILLRDYFGGTEIDHELPKFYKPSYMIIVRTADTAAGLELMKAAVAALTFSMPEEIEESTYRYMRPRALPFAYPPSPGQNIEIAVNMDCCFIDGES